MIWPVSATSGAVLYSSPCTRRLKQDLIEWRTNDNALRGKINVKELKLGNKITEVGKILGVKCDESNDEKKRVFTTL